MTDSSKYYVFYDGDCGFCNHWVQWILENDKKDQFLFSSLQSEFGQQFLNERGLENKIFSTLYLWKPGSFYYTKSQAAMTIARLIGGKMGLVGHLNFFPKNITDFFYDRISANRTKLAAGKCFLPNAEQRKKFIG